MSDQGPFSAPFGDAFEANPYAPTTSTSGPPSASEDVEAYRRAYLNHEASCKSIGTLFLIGAILIVPLGIFAVVGALMSGNGMPLFMVAFGLIYIVMGLAQGFVGVGIRRLQGWARVAGIVLSAIGLLGFPIGTLISGYFLYLLLSQKGQVVFSEPYQRVIAQTPHIKYKTSIIVWIFLVLLLAFLALGIVGLTFG